MRQESLLSEQVSEKEREREWKEEGLGRRTSPPT